MDFIKRNKPIFIVGLITAIAFIVIIYFGQRNSSGINLNEAELETFSVTKETPLPTANPSYTPPTLEETTEAELTGKEVSKVILPAFEISITADGFFPYSAQISQWQLVRWTNNTEEVVTVREKIDKHEEFAVGLAIAPGETYELEVYGTKFWTFEIVETGEIGKLLITPRPKTTL